jgi:hypothetical protein
MKTSPSEMANTGAGKGGIVPPTEHRIKPGEVRNPRGRRTAGASVREWVNVLAEQDPTERALRRISRDKRLPFAKRAAAERMLRMLELPDIADFAAFLNGSKSIEELRAAGVDTAVVKKVKVRNRVTPAGEQFVERELELHDRSAAEFDRVVNTTDGLPTKKVQVNATRDVEAVTSEQIADMAEMLVRFGADPKKLPPLLAAAYLRRQKSRTVRSVAI